MIECRTYVVRLVVLWCVAMGIAAALPAARAEPPPNSELAPGSHRHNHDHGTASSPGEAGHAGETSAGPHGETTATRWPMVLLGGYCVLLVCASLLGGWLPQRLRLSHTQMQTIISFVGGLMLGIAVFHMLPHALVMLGERGPDVSARWMIAGLLVMFFLLRTFHFHQHDPVDISHAHAHCGHEHHAPAGNSGEARAGDAVHSAAPPQAHGLSWLGVFLGLALHTLIDGVALGASVEGDAAHGGAWLFGIGTFLAIFLHIPLDSVSITTVMAAGGSSPTSRNLVNVAFALLCPLGAALFVLGAHQFAGRQTEMIGAALAFSAGVFLCIALSDLLPEMEFHSHNRARLSLALLLGVALAWGIGFLEPGHVHSHHH